MEAPVIINPFQQHGGGIAVVDSDDGPGTPGSDKEVLTIKIRDVNPHVVCILCAGYFIDATTVTECLHTFCKSCIVKYLQTSKCCPMCNIKIHETQPLINLKADRTMQDIVFKLVPNLYENEEDRKREFYKSRGLDKVQNQVQTSLSGRLDPTASHFYRNDEQLSMCLERHSSLIVDDHEGKSYLKPLHRKYLRCSVRTCVSHIRKLLVKKLAIPKRLEVQVLCNDVVLPKNATMKYVWLSQWRGLCAPMVLHYRLKPRYH
ncbi:polycomb group RING finger protein 1-like [Saccoglossus kowalevskii]|uniref:Polycomb group RING finger protein 1-like n=1 Tax=Saccoglossus kowalevskii TaxID=10224 RepID=A0ABM0N1B9_SACKO|nr:PREDICTED: polycomb group RING finger protein 1-like [Saccoglossus kowalevskii]